MESMPARRKRPIPPPPISPPKPILSGSRSLSDRSYPSCPPCMTILDRRQRNVQSGTGCGRRRRSDHLCPPYYGNQLYPRPPYPEGGVSCTRLFRKAMDRFRDIPLSILAHSTHVRGIGTFENGIERPRVRVTLATSIPEAVCKQINLEYRDPASICRMNGRAGKQKEFCSSQEPEKICIG